MRRYTAAEEESVRAITQVRDWKVSGLLDAERAAAIERQLQTDLKRTHWALRAVLFIFAAFVIQSALGLAMVIAHPDEEAVVAGVALVAGLGCLVLGDRVIERFRLYRFGIEEACAVCSIALVAGGVTLFASVAGFRNDQLILVALLAVAVAGLAVYLRFGLLYCLIVAAGCVASTAFFLGLPAMWARLTAAIVLLGIHGVATSLRQPFGEDYPGDDYGIIEAGAWLGVYALLNLELEPDFLGLYSNIAPAFYWATYVAIWLLPIVGLYRGVRQKHHWMIRASLLTALGTLVTNKLYLGWPQHTWDPILLGVLLIGVALGLRRWLAHGPAGQRHGFTPRRLLASEQAAVAQVAMVTALKPGDTTRGGAPTEADQFGGGRSGGAGAGGSF